MSRTPRVMAAAGLVVSGLMLAGCGSSGTVRVPATSGVGVTKAVARLCQAGLRIRGAIYAPGTSAPQVTYALPATYAQAARLRRSKPLVVLATSPPAGTRLAAGSTVALTLSEPRANWDILVPSSRCSGTATTPTLSPAAAARLAQRAAAAALISSGARGPVSGSFVQTTRQAANSLASGEVGGSDQPAVLVKLRGTFSPTGLRGGLVPSSSQPAQVWHTETLVVDAATGAVTDAGFDDSNPDLSVLGTVGALPVLHPPTQTAG